MAEDPLQLFKQKAEGLLTEIEKKRERYVFPLMWSLSRYISKPDVGEIYERLRSLGKVSNLDVILFSSGGDPDQAYLIGSMLQEVVEGKLTFIIPRFAKSASTLMACAADELVMTPASELGPVDLMIEKEGGELISILSLLESLRVVAKMELGEAKKEVIQNLLQKLPPTELGDYNRLSEHMIDLAEKLLSRRMFKEDKNCAHQIAQKLCGGYKSHRACITLADARELGFKLSNLPPEVMDMVWNLNKLWETIVLKYDEELSSSDSKPISLEVGRGIIFSVCPKKQGSK